MGTVLLERVPQSQERVCAVREREWKKKALWSNNRPNVASNKMGRRQSQRRSLPPQYTPPTQEHKNEKRPQPRRKHKPNNPSTKHKTSQHSVPATTEPESSPPSPKEDKTEPKVQPKVQPAAQRCGRREHRHSSYRGSRHTPAFPCHQPSEVSPDLSPRASFNPDIGSLKGQREGDSDSDTDLSESERLPVSPSRWDPPQLELRPEVIEDESCLSRSYRPRGRSNGGFDFPDFLPPPFNSWSLSQLALFYNMEGCGGPRPRAVGHLERYLERLLQLEWCQIQTVQEESGKSAVSEVTSSCHRSAAAATSRLSSPKCILQCQRAFPLTFLSSLANHSALLSGCACTLCRIRYSTSCGSTCCRSTYGHARPSRLHPMLEHRGAPSLPKRSYSESRAQSSERSSASRPQRFSSPTGTNSHLRRMQASGNIRNPAQGANMKPHSTARDCSVWAPFGALWDVWDYETGGFRKRSGSEQRRSGVERPQGAAEKRRSGSECRRGGSVCRRTTGLKDQTIKPDAVTAIKDNLPGKKSPTSRANRAKQVEFVT